MVSPLGLRLDAYAQLSREDYAAIERVSRSHRDIGARQDLVREGDPPRHVYLMLEGWACRYKSLPDGRRQIVAFCIPGDFCDLNVYILKQMDHSISAISRLQVAEISPQDMDLLTIDHPRITQGLWWADMVNASIEREWILNVGQRSAYERIAHVLTELFLRLESVGLTDGTSCDFPLTQSDLADACGLTPVHVNRTLQELRRAGLIVLQGRTLTIPDLESLKKAALFNTNYLHLDGGGRHLLMSDRPETA